MSSGSEQNRNAIRSIVGRERCVQEMANRVDTTKLPAEQLAIRSVKVVIIHLIDSDYRRREDRVRGRRSAFQVLLHGQYSSYVGGIVRVRITQRDRPRKIETGDKSAASRWDGEILRRVRIESFEHPALHEYLANRQSKRIDLLLRIPTRRDGSI